MLTEGGAQVNGDIGGADLRGFLELRAWELAAVDVSHAGLLDPAEQDRATTMVADGTRRDFIAGRIAQRLMAAELLGASPGSLVTAYQCPECGPSPVPSHGRPGYVLQGVRADVSISFSRSRGWAVAAMVPAAGVPLGVDVQHIASVGFAGFDAVALNPAERLRLAGMDPGSRNAWRAAAWARKEALAKFSGLGLRTDPAGIPAFPEATFPNSAFPEPAVPHLDHWEPCPAVWDVAPADLGLPAGFAVAVSTQAVSPDAPARERLP